jgi:hypothetical protein
MNIRAGGPLNEDLESTEVDASRTRPINEQRRAERGLEGSLGAVSRFLGAFERHVDGGEGDLAELRQVHDLITRMRALEDRLAVRLLNEDYSYREVGIALDLRRTAVEKRYPKASSRPLGGQPGALR